MPSVRSNMLRIHWFYQQRSNSVLQPETEVGMNCLGLMKILYRGGLITCPATMLCKLIIYYRSVELIQDLIIYFQCLGPWFSG